MKNESILKRKINGIKSYFAAKKSQKLQQKIEAMSNDELSQQITALTRELQKLKMSLDYFYKNVNSLSISNMTGRFNPSNIHGFNYADDIWMLSQYDINKDIKECETMLAALMEELQKRKTKEGTQMQ